MQTHEPLSSKYYDAFSEKINYTKITLRLNFQHEMLTLTTFIYIYFYTCTSLHKIKRLRND